MNRRTDKERLLTDVFADDPGFREALFAETTRLASRRRRNRRMRHALLSCTVVVGLAIALWPKPSPRAVESPLVARSYGLVVSQPTLNIVETRPFATQVISSQASVQTVHTVIGAGLFREIGDDDLLALTPWPAALVRRGPHSAELIVLNMPDSAVSN